MREQSPGERRARAASGLLGPAPPACLAAPAWRGLPSARLHTPPVPGGAPLLRPARLPGHPASAVAAAGASESKPDSDPPAAVLRAGLPTAGSLLPGGGELPVAPVRACRA